MKSYELTPMGNDKAKSYYGKARVIEQDNGVKVLGYSDYNGTISAIKEAVKEIREEVKQTPTWAQYERECK